VCLHREREPSVEILERREVWLAAELQQGVGFRHSLQVVRDEEGEGRRCVWRESVTMGVLYAVHVLC